MHPTDLEKTAFIIDKGFYCYTMILFRLKNVGVTYQRMMSRVFEKQIGRILKVYIDDMIVKTPEDKDPITYLQETLQHLRRYDLRLNPNKFTFGVEAGKFLGFMLISRGIEVKLDKCIALLNLQSPWTIKEVQ
jgi:hypothetical protein